MIQSVCLWVIIIRAMTVFVTVHMNKCMMREIEHRYGTRAQSPRSPEMPILELMTNTFRPIVARETPLHSRPASRGSAYSRTPTQISERSQTNLNLLGSLMHRIVDDASNFFASTVDRTNSTIHKSNYKVGARCCK